MRVRLAVSFPWGVNTDPWFFEATGELPAWGDDELWLGDWQLGVERRIVFLDPASEQGAEGLLFVSDMPYDCPGARARSREDAGEHAEGVMEELAALGWIVGPMSEPT